MATMYLKAFVLFVVCLFFISDNADKINKCKVELWSNIVLTFGVVLQLVQIFISIQVL